MWSYAGSFELRFDASFAGSHIKDIHEDMMPSWYLPMRKLLLHNRYVRFGCLLSKYVDALLLLELLNDGQDSEKEQGISHLYGVALYRS